MKEIATKQTNQNRKVFPGSYTTLTSAAINANVFIPPKNPTQMHMMNMKPDIVSIDDNKPTKRTCDHPGVVGENES